MEAMGVRRGIRYLSLSQVLVLLLAVSRTRYAFAQDVTVSNDPLEIPSQYRYTMNGSQLSQFDITSVTLIPLSRALWDIGPSRFTVNGKCTPRFLRCHLLTDKKSIVLDGKLQNVNISTATGLPAYTFPYISCDGPDVKDVITKAINSTYAGYVTGAALYTERESGSHCTISSSLAAARWLSLFTVAEMNEGRRIAALDLNSSSKDTIQIFPDLDTLPAEFELPPQRKPSPIRKSASSCEQLLHT
jgi:hypothetical protein